MTPEVGVQFSQFPETKKPAEKIQAGFLLEAEAYLSFVSL
jgi:hypothetical protein